MSDLIDFNDTLFVFADNILNEIIMIPIFVIFKLATVFLFQTIDNVS